MLVLPVLTDEPGALTVDVELAVAGVFELEGLLTVTFVASLVDDEVVPP